MQRFLKIPPGPLSDPKVLYCYDAFWKKKSSPSSWWVQSSVACWCEYAALFIMWIVSHQLQTRVLLRGDAARALKALGLRWQLGLISLCEGFSEGCRSSFQWDSRSLFLWIINCVLRLVSIFGVVLLKRSVFYQCSCLHLNFEDN